MLYTPLTIKAMKLAYNAHHGQLDKSGVPYVFHPYHLAEQMTEEDSVCVALLHDILEDTAVSPEILEAEFPKEVVDAIRLLTHDPAVSYFDYVRAIQKNPLAKAVKLADLAHNTDETRLGASPLLAEEKLEQRREKYKEAKRILEEADPA